MNAQEIHSELNRLLEEERTRDLFRAVRATFAAAGPRSHNWEHVQRVIVNSVEIGLGEGADMSIVLPGTILHDLGYATNPEDPRHHPMHGATECVAYLDAWSPADRERIASCVASHKAKFPGYESQAPQTREEKVVCDADQLDKFGWVGFVQILKVYVEMGWAGMEQWDSLPGLALGLTHQKTVQMLTETGRRVAARLADPDFAEVSRKLKSELEVYETWEAGF